MILEIKGKLFKSTPIAVEFDDPCLECEVSECIGSVCYGLLEEGEILKQYESKKELETILVIKEEI